MAKLLEKYNVNVRRATTKNKHIHTTFVEVFDKELVKQLFKPMNTHKLQDSEKVSAMWVKNLNNIIAKLINIKSLMIDVKTNDAIKLDIVKLDKS